MADISSITLPGGGTYDLKDKNAVPKYGMGKNLLRNWYFVGGGTGRGVFPVNQRGVTSGTFDTNYKINAWKFNYNGTAGNFSFGTSGMTITVPASSTARIAQYIDDVSKLSGRTITVSVVFSDGTFDVGTVTRSAGTLQTIGAYARFLATDLFELTLANVTKTFVAACLEFGTEQTLFHLENGSPVLNYIPDYEYELYRCITSTADSTDTYANKSLATEQQLAYVETGTTASRAYAVGEYFCWNGLLYRVKTAISSGEPFTVGTNCTQTTVGTQLNKIIAQTITTNVPASLIHLYTVPVKAGATVVANIVRNNDSGLWNKILIFPLVIGDNDLVFYLRNADGTSVTSGTYTISFIIINP